MSSISLTLSNGQIVSVQIDRKKMKTCRLKVFPDRQIILSVPEFVSDEWADAFLEEKRSWIEKKLEVFNSTRGYASTNIIKNGFSIQMLGEDLIFSVFQAEKDYVTREDRIIQICVKDPSDQDHIMDLFQKWWKKQALRILRERVDYWYPIIQKYGISKPKVLIRKMKTLWGSCSRDRGIITFNFYLIKAKSACIDYVVLHELTHFLYPNHSKQFYSFLSNYMPDWKERKTILDQEVVHGL